MLSWSAKKLVDDVGKIWTIRTRGGKQQSKNTRRVIPMIPFRSLSKTQNLKLRSQLLTSYGEAGPRVDSRVVVDLRFFGRQSGEKDNRIIFENSLQDACGLPQPTFVYSPTDKFAEETSLMMNEPVLALHVGGGLRLGRGNVEEEHKTSVADYNSQVWKFDNLYVGGNALIPTAFAANPTLTSICLTIRAAHKIHKDLAKHALTPPDPKAPLEKTPADWVKWTKDPKDPNFPNHKELRKPHRCV
ncbi:hypothetical protein DXG01_011250 [Tephrocybe rancida]|nr:hypothetical protein DXG01_011250 [Tephrocybe rancida]